MVISAISFPIQVVHIFYHSPEFLFHLSKKLFSNLDSIDYASLSIQYIQGSLASLSTTC